MSAELRKIWEELTSRKIPLPYGYISIRRDGGDVVVSVVVQRQKLAEMAARQAEQLAMQIVQQIVQQLTPRGAPPP